MPTDLWRRLAAETAVETKTIKGKEITAKFIDEVAQGRLRNYFWHAGVLVIVTGEKVVSDKSGLWEEAAYHEAREAYWFSRMAEEAHLDDNLRRRYAHILAAAEEIIAFGRNDLTPFHRRILPQFSDEQRQFLLDEDPDEDRAEQHETISQYLGLED